MKKLLLCVLAFPLIFFSQDKNDNYIIEGSIFKVSYNEQYEQPNWIEYKVRNVKKNFDRKGRNFYNVDSVFTSNNADYKNNIWDKGHLAPAAAFSDTEANLNATFSFLNCALQHNNLNRYEWSQLERKVREWADSEGDVNVRVDVVFEKNHQTLSTGAHIPTAFKKSITFSDGTNKCFYFLNQPTNGMNWTEFETQCN
ncbi:MAG: DNA/RNA non-specific endonuclease [Flavobacteriaceae bacterium]|nr:DNA/RNA non-specific endonuclease [Flavobacteriaceae bacterium]